VIAAFGLTALMGFSLFPNADIPQFRITIETPPGASLPDTDRAVRFIEAELLRHEEVQHVFANVGRGNPRVYFNIFPEEKKAKRRRGVRRTAAVRPRARPRRCSKGCGRPSPAIPARGSSSRAYRNGPPIAAPIEIAIVGPDLDTLQTLANQAEALMVATPGTRNVDNPARRTAHRSRPAHRFRQGGAVRRPLRSRPTARFGLP